MSFVVPTLLNPDVTSESLFADTPKSFDRAAHSSTAFSYLSLQNPTPGWCSTSFLTPSLFPYSPPDSNLRTSENPEIFLWWILFSVTSQYLLVLPNIMALDAMRIWKTLKGLFLTQTFPLDSWSIGTYLIFPYECLLIILNLTCRKPSSQASQASNSIVSLSTAFSSNIVMGAPHEALIQTFALPVPIIVRPVSPPIV